MIFMVDNIISIKVRVKGVMIFFKMFFDFFLFIVNIIKVHFIAKIIIMRFNKGEDIIFKEPFKEVKLTISSFNFIMIEREFKHNNITTFKGVEILFREGFKLSLIRDIDINNILVIKRVIRFDIDGINFTVTGNEPI